MGPEEEMKLNEVFFRRREEEIQKIKYEDMKAGRVKVQRGTQRTTSNPLLSHSYLHKHCNTSHRELITSNVHFPFREPQGLLFPPLADKLPASVQFPHLLQYQKQI